jgi:CheY-like chemotaxis protein
MAGGTISVESELGKGSTFTVILPQLLSQINHEDPASLVTKHTAVRKVSTSEAAYHYTALVVDDNPLNLLVAKGLLQLFEIEATTVETSPAAIDMLKHHSYDIIFLDYMMPEMDGIETLHAIRDLEIPYCKTIPMIALTANAVNGVDQLLIKEGFNDFISKPIDQKKLGKLLRKWLLISADNVIQNDNSQIVDLQAEAFQQFSKFYSIDWNIGLVNCANQWQAYFSTLALFANDGLRQLEQVNLAFEENDYSLYTVWIHAIKSSILTIGANQIAEQALALELAAKENDIKYLLDNHQDFTRKCGFLCRAIKGFLSAKDFDFY